MNTNTKMKEPGTEERVLGIIRCPYCNATVYADDTTCRYCGEDLAIRFCPYCKNTIPVYEDPCHICGRLEPADQGVEVIDEVQAGINRVDLILGLAIFLLSVLLDVIQ